MPPATHRRRGHNVAQPQTGSLTHPFTHKWLCAWELVSSEIDWSSLLLKAICGSSRDFRRTGPPLDQEGSECEGKTGRLCAKRAECLYMANCHSSGDWQFKQPVAMALPTVILKTGWPRCWAARYLPECVAR